MFNLDELDKLMQNTADIICKDIASAQGIREDEYIAVVDSSLIEPYIVSIDAGYPPVMRLDSKHILKMVLEPDEKLRAKMKLSFRRLLALAFSKVRAQQRTLAIVPIAESIALREGAKRFVRTMFPEKIHASIPDGSFSVKVSATVTVTDPLTNMAVTVNGEDTSLLIRQAKAKLVNLLASNEYFAKLQEEKNFIPKQLPSTIHLTTNDKDEHRIKYDYET